MNDDAQYACKWTSNGGFGQCRPRKKYLKVTWKHRNRRDSMEEGHLSKICDGSSQVWLQVVSEENLVPMDMPRRSSQLLKHLKTP